VGLEHIAPHDLRRTCAKLCHSNGGELEQIQFLLGHASVLTTERYLGCKQNLGHPVNDLFDLKIDTQPGENSSEQHDDGASVSSKVLLPPPKIECRREKAQSGQPDSFATEEPLCRLELDTGT
jgi:hypothetical protein